MDAFTGVHTSTVTYHVKCVVSNVVGNGHFGDKKSEAFIRNMEFLTHFTLPSDEINKRTRCCLLRVNNNFELQTH